MDESRTASNYFDEDAEAVNYAPDTVPPRQRTTSNTPHWPDQRAVARSLDPEPTNEQTNERYERVPEGDYDAECQAAMTYRDPHFRRWTARLRFSLIPGGERIYAFLNLGTAERPRYGKRSAYRRAWLIANDGMILGKRQRMSPRLFKGKLFRVRVRDVRSNYRQVRHPECDVYSVVAEVLEKLP